MKYIIAAIVCFAIAGFAVVGMTADGDYVIPEGQTVTDVEQAEVEVVSRASLRTLRERYEALQAKISYENEIIQNAIVTRDSAIKTGQEAQARKAEYVAERTALRDLYLAIKAAMESGAVTVTTGE